MHTGSCLCGAVSFSFKNAIGDFVFCHCKSCRKASGTSAAANISVSLAEFKLDDENSLIKSYESSPLKFRFFCSHCGSPLFTKVGLNPEVVRVRLGSLDSTFTEQPKAHIFMSHRAKWDNPNQALLEFDEWPSPNSVVIKGSHQPKQ